jgi:putative PIN family toxin of toxin-antitoxin system
VLDTNVVLSALLWGGRPYHLLNAARLGFFESFINSGMKRELEATLARPKFEKSIAATGLAATQLLSAYFAMTTQVPTIRLAAPVCRDPDDDNILACAVAANADVLVTGDEDLLTLKNHHTFWIATPADALAWLKPNFLDSANEN